MLQLHVMAHQRCEERLNAVARAFQHGAVTDASRAPRPRPGRRPVLRWIRRWANRRRSLPATALE